MAAMKQPDYSLMPGNMDVPLPNNMTQTLLNMSLGRGDFNSSTVCVEHDFLSMYVFRPAIQATFRKFLEVCTPEVDEILPVDWTLCTDNGNFSCDSISKYARYCKQMYFDSDTFDKKSTSTQEPCTMVQWMQDDISAILLLVGMVFIGILVGVALTVAVCVIWPGVHRWTMSKVKGDNWSKEKNGVRASTVSSEYYAAIEDNNTTNSIRLRPMARLPSPISDQGVPFQDPRTSPLASAVGDQNFNDPVYQYNGISSEPVYAATSGEIGYEDLNRNNPQNQSHKYASLGPLDPTRRQDPACPEIEESGEHNYVTLEKTT